MKKGTLLVITIFLFSCTPQPAPISYGSDLCHYCKMTIVDRQHASEAVTDKGKIYKFDAIECLLPYILQEPAMDFSFLLVNDYDNPSQLIPAASSHFLISKAIPSPMGGFLTAFENKEKAQLLASSNDGEVYNWNEIIKKYQSLIVKPE